MLMKSLVTLVAFGTVTACAQAETADETQQPQQEAHVMDAAQHATPECWARGDRAKLATRASAFDSASATVGEHAVKVCYSRPQMKGRTVVGGLVPYGEPWRLGANEATVIHMPAAGTIAGVAVEPGSYSLYVVPDSSEWQVVVNRNAERWGIPINEALRASDVGSASVKPETTDAPVEALTARFENVTADGADLVFEWERTRLRVPVTL